MQEAVSEGRYTYIATGMSVLDKIDHAVEIFAKEGCPYELMHCNSAYGSYFH